MKNIFPINVYVPNLAKRVERKKSISNQFQGRTEFNLFIVSAIEHKIGGFGLWQTFHKIVTLEKEKNSPFFIFCEDDHIFTPDYSPNYLQRTLLQADSLGADILSGGVSWSQSPIQCSQHLFWVNAFTGMQFTVVFNRFYQSIIDSPLDEWNVTDIFISGLSNNIFVMYPFISIQSEFGYSDVTPKNNNNGFVHELFKKSMDKFDVLQKVRNVLSQPFV